MTRLYRIMAIVLLIIGLYVTVQAVTATIADVLHTYSPNAIKCDDKGCRTIQADGSLADDSINKPEGTR